MAEIHCGYASMNMLVATTDMSVVTIGNGRELGLQARIGLGVGLELPVQLGGF